MNKLLTILSLCGSIALGTTAALAEAPKSNPQATAPKKVAQKTPSGLEYIMVKEGKGAKPKKGDVVKVHYTGKLENGTIFDSSRPRGTPIEFPLGVGRVIKGWDEGIALLKPGAQAKLIIPAHLAYGMRGAPPRIPPNATLIFDVELVEVTSQN